MRTFALALMISAAIAPVYAQQMGEQNLVASFSKMSDERFDVQVVAPTAVVREYAVCKAVWFAEKKSAKTLSLGNPEYSDPKTAGNLPAKVSEGWVALRATAYLTAPNPDRNPMLSVSERASMCRQMWDWYR